MIGRSPIDDSEVDLSITSFVGDLCKQFVISTPAHFKYTQDDHDAKLDRCFDRFTIAQHKGKSESTVHFVGT
eukprot:1986034-Pyramimonas_sp.AAC.1